MSQSPQENEFSAPPMVATDVPEARQAAPPPPEAESSFEGPWWRVRALTTANYYTTHTDDLGTWGARAELDIWRIGTVLTYDRAVTTGLTLDPQQDLTVLVGYALLASNHAWIRALVGPDVRFGSSTQWGPSFGLTGRFGFSWIAVEADATLTPLPFRRLDTRAALALTGGVFELQGGVRGQWFDDSEGGDLGRLFNSTAQLGPFIALGLTF
ncbi:MAG: hypothetical protein QM723_28165 [Myxococcaceae bacterium]